MSVRLCASAVAVSLVVAGCGSRETPPRAAVASPPASAEERSTALGAKMPATITIATPGLIPEGVEYDTRNKRFLVGSIAQGTVFIVAGDGTLTPFIQDPELISSVGIEVDEDRNRILVVNSDFAVVQGKTSGQAKLGIFDLDTGSRLAMIDLAAAGPKEARRHFANDVTVGADGSAYVTDSLARVVYKVDPSNVVSVFLPNHFGKIHEHLLNGIVFDPAGYLIVAETSAGGLYKVPLDKPAAFRKVKLPEPVTGADGLVWSPDGTLLVIRNDKSQTVVALSSADEWATASIAGRGAFRSQASTAAIAEGNVYVVHPNFGDLKAAPSLEKVDVH